MIILGIILFALLVIVHEYGHFIAARRAGVEVEEFGIGFPPRLFSKKYGDTLYSFNLLPLGGFVKLKGETDADDRPGSFGVSTLWQKTKILMAGVFMNVIAAVAILTLVALIGLPRFLPGQFTVTQDERATAEYVAIAQIQPGSAAEQAGLRQGDTVISIAGTEIDTAEKLREVTDANAGQTVEVTYLRNDNQTAADVTLGTDDSQGELGVVPLDLATIRYTWAAPIVAIGLTGQMIWLTLTALAGALGSLFSGAGGEAAAGLTGPVGVVFLLQNLGDFGVNYLLFLIATISVSLAVLNALPIPALDGGRLAVIGGARALGKKLTPKVEEAIHGVGFALLMLLFIVITYVDVRRFF